jgi:hypothetical protein
MVMHIFTPRRLVLILLAAILVTGCAAPANLSGASPARPFPVVASGSYIYQPRPFVWQVVTIRADAVTGGAGQVYEWSCAGQRWAIGSIPASLHDTYLQFGDERFPIDGGMLDARWHPTAVPDPRRGAALPCADPMPTTKTALSADAARDLVKRQVSAIAPVLVPTILPDRVSATADAQADSFSVLYVGEAGVRVRLRTAVVQLEPLQTGGFEQQLLFRGDAGARYQAVDGRTNATRTLTWLEPATKPSALAAASCPCVPYALSADGLSEDEFWKIARSLQ